MTTRSATIPTSGRALKPASRWASNPTASRAVTTERLSNAKDEPGPLWRRAMRFLAVNMPPGSYELARINWQNLSGQLEKLHNLAGNAEHAVLVVCCDTGDAFLATGIPPVSGFTDFDASFEAFFASPILSRNLLGARSVRLMLPDGSFIFLLPMGGLQGSFADVFRPARTDDTGVNLSKLLAEMSLVTGELGATADRADAATSNALAAAEIADQAAVETRAAAKEAGEKTRTQEDTNKRGVQVTKELLDVYGRVREQIATFRQVVFGEVGG